MNIRNIELVNNPAKFDDDYHFRIKFEAIAPLAEGEHEHRAELGAPEDVASGGADVWKF